MNLVEFDKYSNWLAGWSGLEPDQAESLIIGALGSLLAAPVIFLLGWLIIKVFHTSWSSVRDTVAKIFARKQSHSITIEKDGFTMVINTTESEEIHRLYDRIYHKRNVEGLEKLSGTQVSND